MNICQKLPHGIYEWQKIARGVERSDQTIKSDVSHYYKTADALSSPAMNGGIGPIGGSAVRHSCSFRWQTGKRDPVMKGSDEPCNGV